MNLNDDWYSNYKDWKNYENMKIDYAKHNSYTSIVCMDDRYNVVWVKNIQPTYTYQFVNGELKWLPQSRRRIRKVNRNI